MPDVQRHRLGGRPRPTRPDTPQWLIREALDSRRLSVRWLAGELGVPYRAFVDRVNGTTRISAVELAQIADVLGVQLDDLIPLSARRKRATA